MKGVKRVLLTIVGAFGGGLFVWFYLVVAEPSTSTDNALGAMLVGMVVGCVATLVLTNHSTGPRA